MILKKFRLCLVNYELKINTVPEDATVDFTIGEKQITGSKYITKYPNQNVSFLVKKSGYMPFNGVWNTNEDKEIDVTLEALRKVSGEVINSSLTATNDNVTATVDVKYAYNDGSFVTEQHTKTFSKSHLVTTDWTDDEVLAYGQDIQTKLEVARGQNMISDSSVSRTDDDWKYDELTRILTFTETCASGKVCNNTAKLIFPTNIIYEDDYVTHNFGTTEPTLTDVEVTNTLIEETTDEKKYAHNNAIRITYLNNIQLMNLGGQINISLLPEMWNITFIYTGPNGTIYVNDNVVQSGVATQVVPNSNVEFYVVTSAGQTGTTRFIVNEDNMVVKIVESYVTENAEGQPVPATPGQSGSGSTDLIFISNVSVSIGSNGNSTSYDIGYNSANRNYYYEPPAIPNQPVKEVIVNPITQEEETKYTEMYSLTFVTTPTDATVTVNGSELNTMMKYMKDSIIKYEVAKDGYITESVLYKVTRDETITVNLVPAHNLVINVLPEEADEKITVNGKEYTAGTTLPIAQNSTVEYSITAKKFIPKSASFTMNEDKNITVTLESSGPVDALLADDYVYVIDGNKNVILQEYIGSGEYVSSPLIEQ